MAQGAGKNGDLLLIAGLAGVANWGFRYLPTRLDLTGLPQTGPLARFLAATGPAAIGTLFVASLLPALYPVPVAPWPLLAGVGAVLTIWAARRSVVAATLGGAFAYGLVFALTHDLVGPPP